MLAEGMPEPLADRMLDLERYFREGHASIVTDDIHRVTGRPANPALPVPPRSRLAAESLTAGTYLLIIVRVAAAACPATTSHTVSITLER